MYFDADAGKAGFITALYIMIVPILGMFLGKRVRPLVWFCVLLGACGFYLLTIAGKGVGLTIEKGDLFVLLCAVLFSCHILAIDHFSPKCDGVKLSCLQFFVAGGLSFIMMLIFESPDINRFSTAGSLSSMLVYSPVVSPIRFRLLHKRTQSLQLLL